MSDERIAVDKLLEAANRLPRGRGGIILRHYRTPAHERRALFRSLAAIARRRRLVLMLGGSARQAAAWGADGWHGADPRRTNRPLFHSIPAHNIVEILAARRGKVDFLLLSPLFPTRSHPGAPTLGRIRFARLARQAGRPVIALGGISRCHRRQLRELGAAGWAAIDGLTA